MQIPLAMTRIESGVPGHWARTIASTSSSLLQLVQWKWACVLMLAS